MTPDNRIRIARALRSPSLEAAARHTDTAGFVDAVVAEAEAAIAEAEARGHDSALETFTAMADANETAAVADLGAEPNEIRIRPRADGWAAELRDTCGDRVALGIAPTRRAAWRLARRLWRKHAAQPAQRETQPGPRPISFYAARLNLAIALAETRIEVFRELRLRRLADKWVDKHRRWSAERDRLLAEEPWQYEEFPTGDAA